MKVTQKLLKSDSTVTTTVEKVTFEPLSSHFRATFESLSPGPPKVTFESLLRVFEFFGVWGSVGLLPGHLRWAKTRVLKTDTRVSKRAFKKTSVSKWFLDLF